MRFQAYAVIIIILSVLVFPTITTAKEHQFIPSDTQYDYDVELAADTDDDFWRIDGGPTHYTDITSVPCRYTGSSFIYYGQMRFQLNILKDATIVSAYVSMYELSDSSAATARAWRIDEANVGSLEGDSSLPSVDDSEYASINFDGLTGWDTYSVTNLVQTQVDLGGWSSGQYIGFRFNFTSIDSSHNKAWYDYSHANDYHPYLNVTYELDVPNLRCKLYNATSTTYTDETTDANDADSSDVPLLERWDETPEINDAVYVGYPYRLRGLIFDISTQGVGSWTVAWEYYNGTSWVSLQDLNDATNGFLSEYGDGLEVNWTVPLDWEKSIVDGDTLYWVRARVTYYGAMGFQPKGDQIYPIIYSGMTEEALWSLTIFTIVIGLVMIPASGLYLVKGGRKEASNEKLFYALVIFFTGFALLVGGIMP